jgi:hypothetical protein
MRELPLFKAKLKKASLFPLKNWASSQCGERILSFLVLNLDFLSGICFYGFFFFFSSSLITNFGIISFEDLQTTLL